MQVWCATCFRLSALEKNEPPPFTDGYTLGVTYAAILHIINSIFQSHNLVSSYLIDALNKLRKLKSKLKLVMDKGIFVTRDANLVSKMCQKSIFHDSIARARHAVLNYISYVHCPIVFTLKCTDVHIKPGLSMLLWTVWLFPMSNNGRSIITL